LKNSLAPENRVVEVYHGVAAKLVRRDPNSGPGRTDPIVRAEARMSVQTLPQGGVTARAWRRPTQLSILVFTAKAAALRARRLAGDLAGGPPRLVRAAAEGFWDIAGASTTPLWSDEALAERRHQEGKVQNLRMAARALNGLVLPAGRVFSFWRQVGPPLRARGYVPGRMLRQGCMVASVGGGLCQLSNALYDAALQAGCEILERHAHSSVVPGSAAAIGRDATVAWNYVDLRFSADRDLRFSVRLDGSRLVVRLAAREAARNPVDPPSVPSPALAPGLSPRDCGSCDETGCVLHRPANLSSHAPGPRVFLVDEAWPEFRTYVTSTRRDLDRLGRPFDGAGLGLARYAWGGEGFARVAGAPIAALGRSLTLRTAGAQGAARRQAELKAGRRIALRLGRLLTPDVVQVVVAQPYLPHLWRTGLLGGREVTVLMNRLPMAVIQDRLDAAAAAHPDRASLADFRAPPGLVQAEAEALAEAVRIVTPHAEIAALFGERAVKLAWRGQAAIEPSNGPIRRIGFAGPTVARKGAFAVREAALALNLEVMPLGGELEGPGFWQGVRTLAPGDPAGLDALVQPALVEDQPRKLLAALAAGVRVIASPACGLEPQPGLTLVPADDAEALIAAIRSLDPSR
jgi:hypothetical protein